MCIYIGNNTYSTLSYRITILCIFLFSLDIICCGKHIFDNKQSYWEESVKVNLNKIDSLLSGNKFELAKRYLIKYDKLYTSSLNKNSIEKAQLEESWGKYYKFLNQYKKAIKKYTNSIHNYKQEKDSASIANVLYNIGICYSLIKNYSKSDQYLNNALSYIKHDESNSITPKIYYNLSSNKRRIGEFTIAMIYLNKIDSLNKKYNYCSVDQLVRVYQLKGYIKKIESKYLEALKCYKKAEQVIVNSYGLYYPKLAYVYKDIGDLYYSEYQYEKATDYLNQALYIMDHSQKKDTILVSFIYSLFGSIARFSNNDFLGAIEYYKKAAKLQNYNHHNTYYIFTNIAICYINLGDLKVAEQYLLLAERDVKKKYPDDYHTLSTILIELGNVYLKMYEAEKGFYYLNSGFTMMEEKYNVYKYNYALYYTYIGDYYYSIGSYKEAVNFYHKTIISQTEGFNDTNYYHFPVFEIIADIIDIEQFLRNKGRALKGLYNQTKDIEDLIAGLNSYMLAIKFIEYNQRSCYFSQDKLTFSNTMSNIYKEAMDIAYQIYTITNDKKDKEFVFSISEKCRASSLAANIAENNAKLIADIPDSLLQEEVNINLSISDLYTQIQAIKDDKQKNDEFTELKKRLFIKEKAKEKIIDIYEKEYPNFYNLKYRTNEITLKDIQDKLKEEETIVEYTITKSMLYILTISKKTFDIYRTEIDTQTINMIQKFRSLLYSNFYITEKVSSLNDFIILSYNLFDQLIAPIKISSKCTNLIIIPDPLLANLPFEILITDSTNLECRNNFKNLDYLLRNYNISYSYSTGILYNNINEVNNVDKVYAFAPTYDHIKGIKDSSIVLLRETREFLTPIPGVIEEVKNIKKYFNCKLFIDNEANENSFRSVLTNKGILHLAMHTIIDERNPLNSKLAFTLNIDSVEDGFLNAYEIYSLNMNSNLAVLSACKTGFGKLEKGEGVMSIARAFAYAGCPSVVMTLWSVEDNASSEVMTYFYRFSSNGKSKPEALRLAKLEYLKNADPVKAHPFFWAGYVQIGDVSPIAGSTDFYFIIAFSIVLIAGIGILIKKRFIKIRNQS